MVFNVYMLLFSAIRINENNIKAYYRQVLGLKAQKKQAEALKVAEMGYLKQPAVSYHRTNVILFSAWHFIYN